MQRHVVPVIQVLAATTLMSCESGVSTPHPSLRMHFAGISVAGNYARTLTVADLRQIRDAALREGTITLPISIVDVEAPGRVHVMTTESKIVDRKFIMFDFNVDKSGGIWTIDKDSIRKNNGSLSNLNDRNAIIFD